MSSLNISLYAVDKASNAPETTQFEQTAESAIYQYNREKSQMIRF